MLKNRRKTGPPKHPVRLTDGQFGLRDKPFERPEKDMGGGEPKICRRFGCGKALSAAEQLFGTFCLSHSGQFFPTCGDKE